MTHQLVVFRQPPDIFLTASVSNQCAGTYVHSEFGHSECTPLATFMVATYPFNMAPSGAIYFILYIMNYKFYMKGEFLYET